MSHNGINALCESAESKTCSCPSWALLKGMFVSVCQVKASILAIYLEPAARATSGVYSGSKPKLASKIFFERSVSLTRFTGLGGDRRTNGTNDVRRSSKDGKWLLRRIGKQMLHKPVERGNETPGYKRVSRLLSEPLRFKPGYPERNLRQNVYREHVTLASFSDTHAHSHSRKA
jgi:hypothetical protein